jgi:beta-1,4-mannosyltransferase
LAAETAAAAKVACSGAIFGGTEINSLPRLKIVACPGLRDRGNPYTWLTHAPMRDYGGVIEEFSFYRSLPSDVDILHIHWPERVFWGRVSRLSPVLSAGYALRMLALMDTVKRRGGFVVWTAHNLTPHEPLGPAREAIWHRYFGKFRERVDLIISLSDWAEHELIAAYPDLADKRRAVIPHPHYRTSYPKPSPREEARAALGLTQERFVVLAAGTVTPSKGVVQLAEQFVRIARPDETFLIAGACGDNQELRRLDNIAATSRGSVALRLGWIPEEQIGTLISMVDLSIFNFRTILNSGSVLLSLSFGTRVCAPELGSLKELSATLGPQWFVPLSQPLTDKGLRTALDQARATAGSTQSGGAPLDAFDPDAIAARIYAEYAALVESGRD